MKTEIQAAKTALEKADLTAEEMKKAKEALDKAEGYLKKTAGPEHHIATNKNWLSEIRGGPWSPRFEKLFKKAGMTLEDAANKIRVPGHHGPHPEAYHQEVFRRLTEATKGLDGPAYKKALIRELDKIATEAQTVGSRINKLVTGK